MKWACRTTFRIWAIRKDGIATTHIVQELAMSATLQVVRARLACQEGTGNSTTLKSCWVLALLQNRGVLLEAGCGRRELMCCSRVS